MARADMNMNVEVTPIRHVTVGMGYTMNLGNFESIRFDYSVTDSVRSGELVNEAIDRVEAVVEKRLVDRLNEERNGK